jgi:hypothetical protein
LNCQERHEKVSKSYAKHETISAQSLHRRRDRSCLPNPPFIYSKKRYRTSSRINNKISRIATSHNKRHHRRRHISNHKARPVVQVSLRRNSHCQQYQSEESKLPLRASNPRRDRPTHPPGFRMRCTREGIEHSSTPNFRKEIR